MALAPIPGFGDPNQGEGHWLKAFAPEPIDGHTPRRGGPCLSAKKNAPGIGAFHLYDVSPRIL